MDQWSLCRCEVSESLKCFPHQNAERKSSNSSELCRINSSRLVVFVTNGNNEKVDVMKCSVCGLLWKKTSVAYEMQLGLNGHNWRSSGGNTSQARAACVCVSVHVHVRERSTFVIRPSTGHQLTTFSLGQVLSTWLCGVCLCVGASCVCRRVRAFMHAVEAVLWRAGGEQCAGDSV